MFADDFAVVIFDTDEDGAAFGVEKGDDSFEESPLVFVLNQGDGEVFVLNRASLQGESLVFFEKSATAETVGLLGRLGLFLLVLHLDI